MITQWTDISYFRGQVLNEQHCIYEDFESSDISVCSEAVAELYRGARVASVTASMGCDFDISLGIPDFLDGYVKHLEHSSRLFSISISGRPAHLTCGLFRDRDIALDNGFAAAALIGMSDSGGQEMSQELLNAHAAALTLRAPLVVSAFVRRDWLNLYIVQTSSILARSVASDLLAE